MTDEDAHHLCRRHVWSAGRYSAMAPNLLPAIARLVNVVGVDPGDRVLDVGCGSGNVALTARRVEADVVGVDLSLQMLDFARESAALPGYDDLRWTVGDAEGLPVRDDAFEIVHSNFGHVFAPNSTTASQELVRATLRRDAVATLEEWFSDNAIRVEYLQTLAIVH